MTGFSIRPISALLLLGQAACIGFAIPGTRREPRGNDVGPKLVGAPAFIAKPVAGKEAPHLLVARDGSECVVTEERFERTVIGTSVWCLWLDAD